MCVFDVLPAALQAHQTAILPERLQALGQEHIIVAQEQAASDQVGFIFHLLTATRVVHHFGVEGVSVLLPLTVTCLYPRRRAPTSST